MINTTLPLIPWQGLQNPRAIACANLAVSSLAYALDYSHQLQKPETMHPDNKGRDVEKFCGVHFSNAQNWLRLIHALENGFAARYSVNVADYDLHGTHYLSSEQFPEIYFRSRIDAIHCAIHFAAQFSERYISVWKIGSDPETADVFVGAIPHDFDGKYRTLEARANVSVLFMEDAEASMDPNNENEQVLFTDPNAYKGLAIRDTDRTSFMARCPHCNLRTCPVETYCSLWEPRKGSTLDMWEREQANKKSEPLLNEHAQADAEEILARSSGDQEVEEF